MQSRGFSSSCNYPFLEPRKCKSASFLRSCGSTIGHAPCTANIQLSLTYMTSIIPTILVFQLSFSTLLLFASIMDLSTDYEDRMEKGEILTSSGVDNIRKKNSKDLLSKACFTHTSEATDTMGNALPNKAVGCFSAFRKRRLSASDNEIQPRKLVVRTCTDISQCWKSCIIADTL
jgi:hypothetical protein